MVSSDNQILTSKQVNQKIRRIAHEVLEQNFVESQIVFAGIADMGYVFAERLKAEFDKITSKETELVKVSLDKNSPLQSVIKFDVEVASLEEKVVILTDDVLNTGRTLAYSLKPFLNVRLKKLQTAVVVGRNHKTFPISADYVGYALSTTLQERIQVVLGDTDEASGVYLQ